MRRLFSTRGFLRHPSRSRLEAWLEGGDETLDDHLSTCERCAERLELAARPVDSVALFLENLVHPPPDLQVRVHRGIARRLQAREDLRLMAEMLGIPGATLRAIGPTDEVTG